MPSGKQRSEVRWWHIRALPSSVCQREQASVCVCVVFLLSLPTMTCRIRPRLLSKTKRRRLCVCVCVCLCLAERHRAWHGIFYMVRLASWWLKSEFARRSDDHPGNFSSRFLIFFFPFLSRGHFNLPPPRVDVIVCFCIHSVGILARK